MTETLGVLQSMGSQRVRDNLATEQQFPKKSAEYTLETAIKEINIERNTDK